MQEYFKVNGVQIATPTSFKPVFATTSTDDSDRTQDLVMHNTPMGTVEGYDLQWDGLTDSEISIILKNMINKSSFRFYYHSPFEGRWIEKTFYASNFSMEAQTLKNNQEKWDGLTINVRSINPI